MFKWLSLSLWITTLVVDPGVTEQTCECFVSEYGSAYCTGDNNGYCEGNHLCSTQCYCGSNHKFCTSDGGGCIEKHLQCCGFGWKWCRFTGSCQRVGQCCSTGLKWCASDGGGCIQKAQTCCGSGNSWCGSTNSCQPTGRCCDRGKSWCQSKSTCKPQGECCKYGSYWCTTQGRCNPNSHECCAKGKSWCSSKGSCISNNEKCCDSSEKWCGKRESCIPKDKNCDCLKDSYLCDKTNICIPEKHVCELCKIGDILCTYIPSNAVSQRSRCYSISSFEKYSNVKVCQDGNCRQTQTNRNWECEESPDGCPRETYKCGKECRPNKEFVNFRTCEGRCIRRNETCTKDGAKTEDTEGIKTTNMNLVIGLGAGGGVMFCLIVAAVGFMISLKKKREKVLYVEENPVYGETGEEEYEMNEIIDTNDYYGADDESE